MSRKRSFFLLLGMICLVGVWLAGQSKANILVKSTPLQMEPEKVQLPPIQLELDEEKEMTKSIQNN